MKGTCHFSLDRICLSSDQPVINRSICLSEAMRGCNLQPIHFFKSRFSGGLNLLYSIVFVRLRGEVISLSTFVQLYQDCVLCQRHAYVIYCVLRLQKCFVYLI